MKTSCLINNYNYRHFVSEAVDSALAQRPPFDEVIVVDDGSTDDSSAYLQHRYALEPRVRLIDKPNGGQLSAMRAGVEAASGDVLCFLDADDLYLPGYTQWALAVYEQRPIDFLTVAFRSIGAAESPRKRRRRESRRSRDLGFSLLRVLIADHWIGGPTSTLSMRSETAERILQFPHDDDWRIRADDVLVIGASLVGARKYYLDEPLISYRNHGDNHYLGRRRDPVGVYRHGIRRNRLAEWFRQRGGLNVDRLRSQIHREFNTISQPTWPELRQYLRWSSRSKLSLRTRARQFGSMIGHFTHEKLWGKSTAVEPLAVVETSENDARRAA